MPRTFPSASERLSANVDKRGPDECWPWLGRWHNPGGYGRLRVDGKPCGAHQLAKLLESGGIPDGMLVLHTCDNPACCNPAHLWFGTDKDNLRDASRKGRTAMQRYPDLRRGERSSQHKLTWETVDEIRLAYATGLFTQQQLADRFGVVRQIISGVVNFDRWNFQVIEARAALSAA